MKVETRELCVVFGELFEMVKAKLTRRRHKLCIATNQKQVAWRRNCSAKRGERGRIAPRQLNKSDERDEGARQRHKVASDVSTM